MSVRARLSGLLVAGTLTTGLIAGASALASQPVRSPGAAGVSNHRAVEVLHQAQRALAGKGGDATIALSKLAVALPKLSGAHAAAAQALLARPTSNFDPQGAKWKVKEHDPPFCTDHFCIHWVDSTKDAPSPADANANGIPDFVERVAAVCEVTYETENTQLGWRPPKPDGKLGGNARTDVYLSQIGNQGLFGYAAPDAGQSKKSASGQKLPPPRSEYAYLVLDQNFSQAEFEAPPNESLAVTVAHEYNHILQFNYDIYQDTWAKESTATWMEDEVFNSINDYHRYLPAWVRRTKVPLTFFSNGKVYGSTVWNKWLSARYGVDLIRNVWEKAIKVRPAGFSADAYNAAIREAGGSSFSRDFGRFALDTAEWRTNDRFPEGADYPDVKRSGKLNPNGGSSTRPLSHTGYELIDVPVPKGGKSLRLTVGVPGGTRSAIGLVGRIGNGSGSTTSTRLKFLLHGGTSSVDLGLPSRYSRITAVIANTDVRQKGYSNTRQDWFYTRDHVPFRVSASINR